MNIIEFINKFNDVIPYQFELNIGGSKKKDIITNKELISNKNFKGKMLPFYETKFGKTETKYIPIHEISVPIDIKVICDGMVVFDANENNHHTYVLQNLITKTRKGITQHIARLINEDGKQYGCIQLELNASGDITNKCCSYNNEDFTHEIFESIDYTVDSNGKIITSGCTSYTEKDYERNVETKVEIYQTEGTTTGIQILRRRLQTREDIIFQSITDLTKDFTSDDTYYCLARTEFSSYQEVISKHYRMAHENSIIEEDLIEFRLRKAHIDLEKDMSQLVSSHVIRNPISYYANDDYYEDEHNDLLYGFIGEYTGNTIVRKNDNLILIVRTRDNDFNYYTEIDLTGTDPFIGSSPFADFYDEERDIKYFKRIKESSKEPKFKTQVINGKECLVPQNGNIFTQEEIEEFLKFKEFYLESFEEINKLKLAKLLHKKK